MHRFLSLLLFIFAIGRSEQSDGAYHYNSSFFPGSINFHIDSSIANNGIGSQYSFFRPDVSLRDSFDGPFQTEFTTAYNGKKDSLFVADTSYHHLWKRATIWSACIPGAGQVYNEIGYRKVQNKKHRAWWKVPIIYGALGVTGYYFYQNLSLARSLKTEWIFRQDNPNQFLYPEYVDWSDNDLIQGNTLNGIEYLGFDDAAKRRDLLAFGFLAIWGLNVVEALVDGHFVTFDVSEDLSLNWQPVLFNPSTPGVSLRLNIN